MKNKQKTIKSQEPQLSFKVKCAKEPSQHVLTTLAEIAINYACVDLGFFWHQPEQGEKLCSMRTDVLWDDSDFEPDLAKYCKEAMLKEMKKHPVFVF